MLEKQYEGSTAPPPCEPPPGLQGSVTYVLVVDGRHLEVDEGAMLEGDT